jgi:sirohydrochlorin cobaltochelatase
MIGMSEAIILFAHGSRDPQWAEPLRALEQLVRQRRPQAHVALAFLELMQPDLDTACKEAASSGAASAVIVPLFLAAGAHLKNDLPALVDRAAHANPRLRLRVLPPIGESESLLAAIADWVAAGAS